METKNEQGLNYINLKGGEVLFEEGSKGNSFYIVQKGLIEISVMQEGEKTVIATAEAGDSIGEFAFVTKKPRSATVAASGDASLIEVSSEVYQKLFDEIPFWAQAMIQELVRKLVSSTDLIKKSQVKNKELLNALHIILE